MPVGVEYVMRPFGLFPEFEVFEPDCCLFCVSVDVDGLVGVDVGVLVDVGVGVLVDVGVGVGVGVGVDVGLTVGVCVVIGDEMAAILLACVVSQPVNNTIDNITKSSSEKKFFIYNTSNFYIICYIIFSNYLNCNI